jgi:hypothetical protein
MFDLDEEIARISELVPDLPIPESRFREIVAAVRQLDSLPSIRSLIELTLLPRG